MIPVKTRIISQDVIDQLFKLIASSGVYPMADSGPEFTAKAIRGWLNRVGVKTLFIEPESPWENWCMDSFAGKLRDELLYLEIFTTLTEAKVSIK